jgi:hypothetical protein
MKSLPWGFIFVALVVLLGSCAPELDLPPPPDIQGRLEAFESPDAEVVADILAEVAEEILELYDQIDQSSFYEEVIDVIADVQEEIYNEEGEIDLGGGVTFETPNGGVTVEYICDGWNDPPPRMPDPENGSIELNLRLAGGGIAPLVWGEIADCQYPIEIGESRFNARASGGVAVYFGEPLPAGRNLKEVPEGEDPSFYTLKVIFVVVGLLAIEETELPIDDLFQVTFAFDDQGNFLPGATVISLLIGLPDGTSFRYSFAADLTQKLEDRVGEMTCSLEDRTCEGPSRAFSW